MTPIHFIVGVGRSGTTLLVQWLNANEQCLATPERQFIMTFYQKYANNSSATITHLRRDIARYYQTRSPKKATNSIWQFEQRAFEQALNQQNTLNYAQVCQAFLQNTHYLGRSNEKISCIIDKNPNYSLYVAQLWRVFPNAKFVVALRDYRAVLNSHLQSRDNSFANIAFWALLWQKHYRHLWQLTQQYPDRFLWLKYEDITTDPQHYTQQLCNFLGVTWSEKMLYPNAALQTWVAAQTPEMSERKRKKWGDLARKTYTHQRQNWQTQLKTTHIQLADLLCANIGQQLGYKPQNNYSTKQKITLLLPYLPALIYAHIAYFFYAYYYYLPLNCRILLIKYFKLKR
jgi:hypothetical protein